MSDPVAGEDFLSLEEGRLVVSVDDMPLHDEAGTVVRMVMFKSTGSHAHVLERCTLVDWHAWVEAVGALGTPK